MRKPEIFLFSVLLGCYIYFFPRWADPNQNSRLDMVVAVVEDGTFQIDKYVSNTVDYAKVGDHYYSDKAPGVALLGIPIYAGLRTVLNTPLLDELTERLEQSDAFATTLRPTGSGVSKEKVRFALAQVVLTYALASLPSALLGVLIFRLMTEFGAELWPRLGVVLGYGLLTPAFAYAGAFYGHQLSAALLMGAFSLMFLAKERLGAGRLLLIGLLLGYSVLTEYSSLLLVGVLLLYLLHLLTRHGRPIDLLWTLLGGAAIATGWMAYNNAVFGGPFELGYRHSTLWQEQHDAGFMSLTRPQLEAVWGITFSPFRGIFLLSPWILLCLPGMLHWWRTGKWRAEFLVVAAGTLVFFVFNASSVMWWGGFAIGARYLLPALPFMVLPAFFAFRDWAKRKWGVVTILFLLAWSLAATWGLTLANQAFPPDTIRNPLVEYAWPNWLSGNIARNLGNLVGIRGLWSLVPLVLAVATIGLAWWKLLGRSEPSLIPDARSLAPISAEPAKD